MANETTDLLLWVERYRPKTIKECILPTRIKGFLQSLVDKKEVHNIIAVGTAGTGKTSSAKALCEELGADVLFINASENGNIDTVRNDIRSHASTVSFGDLPYKVVILDEVDGSNSPQFQPSLRAFIEEFRHSCRFIMTANYSNKIIDALKSRCTVLDFSLTKEEKQDVVMQFNKRAKQILEQERIVYDQKTLAEIVIKFFPDYRKIIGEIQRYSFSGELSLNGVGILADEEIKTLVSLIKAKKWGDCRKWVTQNQDIDFHMLISAFYNHLIPVIAPDSIPELVIMLHEADYKYSFCVNKELATIAMVTEVMINVQFK